MALSVLMPNHDGLVKEEESDDFEYMQEPMLLAGLMANGNSANGHSYPPVELFREVKEELEEPLFSTLPGCTESPKGVPAGAGDRLIKEEPIDCIGESALLSLAASQDHLGGVEQSALELFSQEVKLEDIDEEEKDVPLLPQMGSNRRKIQYTSSSYSGDDDERIYISREHLLEPQRPKRGRPMGPKLSEEEVASDPKKRRQANNREAALRYREKKKMETAELKYEENHRLEMNAYLRERVDDISQEVHRWKRLCMKAFSFLPEYDFEDHSPIPRTPTARRSMSTSESIGSTSPAPDRAAQVRAAALKLRAKRREEATRLREEEDQLTARNEALRAEALQLYIEIVNLRKQMGFGNAKTSADKDLPAMLRSTQFSSLQISDFLSSIQS